MKKRLCRLAYWSLVILSMPVASSRTAPVAVLYASNASVASRTRVVPTSMIPAVEPRMGVSEPYVTDISRPRYFDAGDVVVIDLCPR